MPRTRDPNRTPPKSESVGLKVRKLVRKGHRVPGSGRAKGKPNYLSTSTRLAIIQGLSEYAGGDLVDYVRWLAQWPAIGADLLKTITPRELAVAASITRTDVVYKTIAELDQDLAQHGLPTSHEIFKLDYGSTVLDADEVVPGEAFTEVEVVAEEITAKKPQV